MRWKTSDGVSMTWTATTESADFNSEPWMDAAVSVVDNDSLGPLGAHAAAHGFLWIELREPGPQHRGRLGLYIEECIESKLEERGALPPGIQASTGLDASLSDQLYRARLVEMRGIALGVPSLEGITNLGRALDAEDSGVLRWWLAATAERPVRVILSRENMRLRVYPSPVLFETLFDVAPEPVSPRVPSVAMAESAETMALSDLPPLVAARESHDDDDTMCFADGPSDDELAEARADFIETGRTPFGGAGVDLPELDRALGLTPDRPAVASLDTDSSGVALRAADVVSADLLSADALSAPLVSESVVALPAALSANRTEPSTREDAPASNRPEPWRPRSEKLDAEEFLRVLEEDSARLPEAVPAAAAQTPADEEPVSPLPTKVIGRQPFIRMAEPGDEPLKAAVPSARVAPGARAPLPALTGSPAAAVADPAALDEDDPFVQLARREWKTWAKNLEAARGPKPLAVVERQFVTDYTRLREAVRRGLADTEATSVLDAWQQSFSTSYAEAFDALRVRGKRPTMVLDVPELAQRLGRLQGARRVQLLLVDGMRFDLGLMVQERLRTRVDAALTERLLLWSALPTITTYQLELLGKGPEGLREDCSTDESPALVARGRAASSPRRIRTGRLELLKIDVVEDALREPGLPMVQRLPDIADRTADALAEHLGKQAPRTLVLVFGDHGFLLDPKAVGTTEEVRQGGSSPEEVLVPAFAWLTGAVH